MPKIKGIVRYPHVCKASAPQGTDNKKFSLCLLIAKNDSQKAQLDAAYNAAVQNGFPSGKPANFHDGYVDLATVTGTPAELHNYMQLKVSTNEENGKPVLVDSNLQPIMDPSWDSTAPGKVVWVDCSDFTAYNKGSNGVKAYLNGVMDTGEMGPIPADKLSSKPTAESMFGDVAATGSATPPPTAPSAPPAAPSAPPAAPQYVMTEKANGITREAYIQNGWTDELLIQHGMMIQPSFA